MDFQLARASPGEGGLETRLSTTEKQRSWTESAFRVHEAPLGWIDIFLVLKLLLLVAVWIRLRRSDSFEIAAFEPLSKPLGIHSPLMSVIDFFSLHLLEIMEADKILEARPTAHNPLQTSGILMLRCPAQTVEAWPYVVTWTEWVFQQISTQGLGYSMASWCFRMNTRTPINKKSWLGCACPGNYSGTGLRVSVPHTFYFVCTSLQYPDAKLGYPLMAFHVLF